MRCYAPNCRNTVESEKVRFHQFPSEAHLRAAWLRALGKKDSHLPDSAVVCSQHFLHDDICETENGSTQLHTNAVPSTVLVCMICLDTDSKMILMRKYNLRDAYEKLTGYPLCDGGNLKQTLCVQCAQRLRNFSRFRGKSLRARSLMMELLEKHELITMKHMESINDVRNQLKSTLAWKVIPPDHCDVDMKHVDSDKQTKANTTAGSVAVKSEQEPSKWQATDVASFKANVTVLKKECLSPIRDYAQPLDINRATSGTDPSNSNQRWDVKSGTPEPKPSTSKDQGSGTLKIKYEITFECSVCLEEFADEDAYNCHMMMHDESNQNQHEGSPMEYPQTSVAPMAWELAKKMKSHHEVYTTVTIEPFIKEKTSICVNSKTNQSEKNKKCENSLKSILYQNLNDQTITHTGETRIEETHTESIKLPNNISSDSDKRFKCDFCVYKTKYKIDLVRHIRTHTGEKPYACQFCPFRSAHQKSLAKHLRTHTGENTFACTMCDFKCTLNRSLVKHMRKHTGEEPFPCTICEYKCKTQRDLTTHMCTHTGEKPFSCDLCDYKCTRKSDLIKHIKIHTGEKSIKCELCPYRCIRRGDLTNHMKIHTGKKSFVCDLCDFKCVRNCGLVRHMKTHTGEKPYACTICEYRCSQNSTLLAHVRTHTGEKPFSCTLCEYKCARKSTLLAHVRIHTGEKPFACVLCEYRTSRRSSMARHIKTHTQAH